MKRSRVLLVGASSGLGRAVGVGLAGRGAQVALAARRVDRLESAAAEAGNGSIAVRCDVTNPEQVKEAVDATVAAFGGLDAIVYATGVGYLSMMAEATAEQWASVFATNVTGAALVSAAALPHLEATNGRALYFSSVSALPPTPWPGLGLYATAKTALVKMVAAFQGEHPNVGFTCLSMGDSAGGDGDAATEFSSSWPQELFDQMLNRWLELGLMRGGLIDVADLTEVVATILDSPAQIPSFTLMPQPW